MPTAAPVDIAKAFGNEKAVNDALRRVLANSEGRYADHRFSPQSDKNLVAVRWNELAPSLVHTQPDPDWAPELHEIRSNTPQFHSTFGFSLGNF